MQAVADATGLPVQLSKVADGAALGAAFLGRLATGAESSITDAARWAAVDRVVEPDPRWTGAARGPLPQILGTFLTGSRAGQRNSADTYRTSPNATAVEPSGKVNPLRAYNSGVVCTVACQVAPTLDARSQLSPSDRVAVCVRHARTSR